MSAGIAWALVYSSVSTKKSRDGAGKRVVHVPNHIINEGEGQTEALHNYMLPHWTGSSHGLGG